MFLVFFSENSQSLPYPKSSPLHFSIHHPINHKVGIRAEWPKHALTLPHFWWALFHCRNRKGIQKLSEIYPQGTGLKESYERQVLLPEANQGPFLWCATCGGCPGTSPWPPQAAKAFLLQGSSDCSRRILAAVPWLCHPSLFSTASSSRNTQLLPPHLSEPVRGAETWVQQLETLLHIHIQLPL